MKSVPSPVKKWGSVAAVGAAAGGVRAAVASTQDEEEDWEVQAPVRIFAFWCC
jgi:hypothetical protein